MFKNNFCSWYKNIILKIRTFEEIYATCGECLTCSHTICTVKNIIKHLKPYYLNTPTIGR